MSRFTRGGKWKCLRPCPECTSDRLWTNGRGDFECHTCGYKDHQDFDYIAIKKALGYRVPPDAYSYITDLFPRRRDRNTKSEDVGAPTQSVERSENSYE